jgi:hypothetical protein
MVVDVARQARNVGAPFHVSLESAGIKLAPDSADRPRTPTSAVFINSSWY